MCWNEDKFLTVQINPQHLDPNPQFCSNARKPMGFCACDNAMQRSREKYMVLKLYAFSLFFHEYRQSVQVTLPSLDSFVTSISWAVKIKINTPEI